MNRQFLQDQYGQLLHVFYSIGDAVYFARKNRLWEGFMAYGWVSRLSLIVGSIAGLRFLQILWKYVTQVDPSNAFVAAGMLGSFAQEVVLEEYKLLFSGGMKYGTLVLLEIFIFHITFRTLCVLLVKSGTPTLKDFMRAQLRMLQISVVCWFLESVFSMIARTALDLAPFSNWLTPGATFIIQCIFMGVPILDNFTEQFKLGIKQSIQYMRSYVGVALGVGMLLQLFFVVPVVGNVLGPILVSIISAITMYELSDLTSRRESAQTLEEELV